MICLVGNMPVQGMVGVACMGVRWQEAAARLEHKEGSPGLFVVVVVVILVDPWTAQASIVTVTGGLGGGGGAAVVASRIPLLSDGEL